MKTDNNHNPKTLIEEILLRQKKSYDLTNLKLKGKTLVEKIVFLQNNQNKS